MTETKKTLLLILLPICVLCFALAILLGVAAAKKRRRCVEKTQAAVVKWLFPSAAFLEYTHGEQLIRRRVGVKNLPLYDENGAPAERASGAKGKHEVTGVFTHIMYNPEKPKEIILLDKSFHGNSKKFAALIFGGVGLVFSAVLAILLWQL